jgi:hypothetical protein
MRLWHWLLRLACPHRSWEMIEYRDSNRESWSEVYWLCHDCGKSRGRPI